MCPRLITLVDHYAGFNVTSDIVFTSQQHVHFSDQPDCASALHDLQIEAMLVT